MRGIHRWSADSPHKGTVKWKVFSGHYIIIYPIKYGQGFVSFLSLSHMYHMYQEFLVWIYRIILSMGSANERRRYIVFMHPFNRFPWWRHQMETFSALLALCAGNSPVSGEFPAQRPVTRSFDVFFDLRPNKRLSKKSWGWWFETLLSPLWRHRNASVWFYWHWSSRILAPVQVKLHWFVYYHQASDISRTKIFNVSCLVLQLSLPNPLKSVENEDVVGAAPTGDAPTTSEWSTIFHSILRRGVY